MAKKKSGSIAVPFLVTIFIGLILVGGAAYGIYRYLGFGKTEAPPEPTPRTGQSVTYDDNHTILLILDEPEQRCSSTFVLIRSIPIKKEIILILFFILLKMMKRVEIILLNYFLKIPL